MGGAGVRRGKRWAAAATLAALVAGLVAAAPAPVQGANPKFKVLVTFRERPSRSAVDAVARRVGDVEVSYRYRHLPVVALEVPEGRLRALAASPGVERVEEDRPFAVSMAAARESFGVDAAVSQHGLTGEGTVIAVVDTGIHASHQSLDGGKVVHFADCTGATCAPGAAFDDHGHGTHVASIAAGDGGGGVTGVAPAADLVGIKVFDSEGNGTSSDVDAGFEYLIDHAATLGVDVVNFSGGGAPTDGTDSTSLLASQLVDAGVPVFAAAGNEGPDLGTVGSPATADKVTAVGAMSDPLDDEDPFDDEYDPGFALAGFSSRGPTPDGRTKPDIAAPGVDISAAQAGTVNGTMVLSGTSMASPFAAGVAALMLEADPSLAPTPTSNPLEAAMRSTAEDWGRPGTDRDYGAGRLDAAAAIGEAAGPVTGPALPVHSARRGCVGAAGEADVYKVVSDTTWPLAATLLIEGSGGNQPDLDLVVERADGSVVAQSTSGTLRQEAVGFLPSAAQTYYVSVEAFDDPGSYVLDVSASGAATLVEDSTSTACVPSVSVGNAVVKEGDGLRSVAVAVKLSRTHTAPVAVSVATVAGTASGRTDFVPLSRRVTIPAGARTAVVRWDGIRGGLRDEPSEYFRVVLSSPASAVLGDRSGRVTIEDDDPRPFVDVFSDSVNEPDRSGEVRKARFKVALQRRSGFPVLVDFRTVAGGAGPADFVAREGTVRFDPGERVKVVRVRIRPDALREGVERFRLRLTDATKARIDDGVARGRIFDADS